MIKRRFGDAEPTCHVIQSGRMVALFVKDPDRSVNNELFSFPFVQALEVVSFGHLSL
jgi:hypothetical protein